MTSFIERLVWSGFDLYIVLALTVMTMCGDWTGDCGDGGTMVRRCNVVNDGDLAEFVSFTGLILVNTEGRRNITTLIEY